jgi:DNA-binding XRE family transcriptional regulator
MIHPNLMTIDDPRRLAGLTLKAILAQLDMTPYAFADRAGLKRDTVVLVAAGRATPRDATKAKIAAALGMAVKDIVWEVVP